MYGRSGYNALVDWLAVSIVGWLRENDDELFRLMKIEQKMLIVIFGFGYKYPRFGKAES